LENRLCQLKILFLYYVGQQTTQAIVLHALIYICSFSARKIVIKTFCPILYVLHCPFDNAFFILVYKRMKMVNKVQKSTCLWRIPSTTLSVETGYFPYSFITLERKRSTTNTFRSFDMSNERISLYIGGSITIQSHINSEPTFIAVSSFYI
jgi:hypothetical protein